MMSALMVGLCMPYGGLMYGLCMAYVWLKYV